MLVCTIDKEKLNQSRWVVFSQSAHRKESFFFRVTLLLVWFVSFYKTELRTQRIVAVGIYVRSRLFRVEK